MPRHDRRDEAAAAARGAAMTVASPCIGVCQIEAAAGLCLGCARSLDEIAAWGAMAAEDRGRVWAALPARRAALGLPPAPDLSPADEAPR